MDSEGILYGLTRNAWMRRATEMATTASTAYSMMVRPVEAFLPLLAAWSTGAASAWCSSLS